MLIIHIKTCVISIQAVSERLKLSFESLGPPRSDRPVRKRLWRLIRASFTDDSTSASFSLKLLWISAGEIRFDKENLLREIITPLLKAVCVCVIPHQLNEGIITSSPLLKRPDADMKAWSNRRPVIRTDEWWQTKTRQKDCFSSHPAFELALSSGCQSSGKHTHTNMMDDEIFISWSELLRRVVVCGGGDGRRRWKDGEKEAVSAGL